MSATNYKTFCLHVSTTITLIMVVALVVTTKLPQSPAKRPFPPIREGRGSKTYYVKRSDQWEPVPHHVVAEAQPWTNENVGNGVGSTVVRRRTWEWTEVFAFVPNGIRSCQKLFSNDKYLVEPFLKVYSKFEAEVKKYDWVEGNSALRIEQYLTYIKLAESPFVRTVCETGFNAGHSTLAWLEANPRTRVYSFDIGEHQYARPMAEYLSKRYPGRLNVTWGDSTHTLPTFHFQHPDVKCDLLIVDGGHTNAICQADFDIFYKMANVENVVVLDNYPDSRLKWMTDLGNVWERAKRRGELFEIFSCSFEPADPHGFSVGRFKVGP
ncbi:hypothetical protein LSH36_574g00000 [Paralvinella palmiformis]|uniref:Uncharacterized protein n=1 Tax=Paralvinella palmiformis TaxID=53620 RepID=A0AAD9MXV6_9ANNE|nr:hypothetical protein LSH36_574g00000 [Paralvinella palmiformis]